MANELIREFMNAVTELLQRVEDGRALIDEGKYDYERAFVMAEKQVARIRGFASLSEPKDGLPEEKPE